MIPSWEKCFFGDVANVKNGFAFKSTLYAENGIPVVRISDIKGGKVNTQGSVRVPMKEDYQAFLIEYEDVLIAMSGATTGKFGVFTGAETALQNQRVGNIRPKSLEVLNKRFMFYFLYSAKKEIERLAYGGAQPNISASKIEGLCFKLPPLNEQKRIVAKIEELFSELDKGIESLKKARKQLTLYRQAVLKQAFEGKFFNSTGIRGKAKINSLCEVVRGGSPRPAGDPKYYDGEIPFLKVADITRNKGVYLTKYEYSIKPAGLHKTRLVGPNTLLLSNSGATLGMPKIVQFETTFNDGIAAFLNLDEESILFHYYFWLSKTRELRSINQGAAQPNLNTNMIGEMEIPVFGKEKQQKIVNLIETQFSVIDQLEADIDTNLKKAETLRQSILKKAFSGQLVPQDPTDEPASVLLKKIKAEKAKLKPSKKRKKGAPV